VETGKNYQQLPMMEYCVSYFMRKIHRCTE